MSRSFSTRGGDYRHAPTTTYPDHLGRAAPDAVYWVPPDPSLGEIRSAHTNRTRDGFRREDPKTRALKLLGLGLFAGLAVFLLGMGTTSLINAFVFLREVWLAYVFWVPFALVAVALLARPRPLTSYVGEKGFAEHVKLTFGSRHTLLSFDDARSSFGSQTARYTNGAYQGTEYRYRWLDADGHKLVELAGIRFDRGTWAGRVDPAWDFVLAAKRRWGEVRLARAEEDYARDRQVAFDWGKGSAIAIREGALELRPASGPTERLMASELREACLEEGCLVLRRVGAEEGLLRSRGITRIPLGDVADADTLMIAMRRWAGIRVSGS